MKEATHNPSPPRASIIIVNYNGGDFLSRCIQSLIDATTRHSAEPSENGREMADEIIVVDNGSHDGSDTAIEQQFPHVRLIRSGENLGFGDGNNLGVEHASGTYLAFLNPDALVDPAWLDHLIDALESDPTVGAATSKILLHHDPTLINTCGGNLHLTGLALCRGMSQPASTYTETFPVDTISGAAFVMRRDLYEQIGGFDGTFFLYMEDTDISLRVRLAGYQCVCVPDSLVYHDYELRFGPKKTYYQESNRYRMLLKIFSWKTLLVLLPALLLAEVVTWGFVILRDRARFRNKLHAYASVVKQWGDIMQQRQRVQATRRASDRDLLAATTHHLDFEQTGAGFVTMVSHWVFDPLFWVLRAVAMKVA